MKQWQSAPATRELTLSVNVAERQLGFHDFFDQLAALLTLGGIDGLRLLLDVSAASLAKNGHHLQSHRELLAHYGIRISVDDFGTTSLPIALLEELPIHSLKVDPQLVGAIGSEAGREKARRLVRIAKAFGLPATAEGVEDARLRPLLSEVGFEFAQGFIFQAPIGSEEAAGVAGRML